MARSKSPSAKNHRKTLKLAKGFKQARRTRIKVAKEAVLHAGQYAYAGRRLKRRDLTSLWIIRLNAAAREHGLKYSTLVKKLKDNKIDLNKKMLSEIVVKDPDAFKAIITELDSGKSVVK